jgi:hypothetical protein
MIPEAIHLLKAIQSDAPLENPSLLDSRRADH